MYSQRKFPLVGEAAGDHRSASFRVRMPGPLALLASAVALLLGQTVALADEAPNLLTDRFQISLGTFVINSKPTVEFDGSTNNGSSVDFNRELGGGDVSRIRLDSSWRFAEKHKVNLIAFSSKREGSRVIDKDIEWNGDIYPVDARVDFKFDFSVIELAYEYEFLHRDNYEIGGSVGLHYTQFATNLTAKASESNGNLAVDLSNNANIGAPLPVFGLQGAWKLPHDFWIKASGQFFSLTINEYSGNVQDYRAMVIWQPNKWAGVGVGFDRFSVNVDITKDAFNGTLDWTYNGPMVFYNVSF